MSHKMSHIYRKEASMKRWLTCVCALALLAGPVGAVTRDDGPGRAAAPAPRQGTINSSGAVASAGKTYAVSSRTQVFDRKGAPLAAARLAPGRSVAFTATTDGVPTVRQLWLVD